jgi:hypothetical protein
MFRIFKIQTAGTKKGGQDLLGLLIVQSSEGFYVIAPEPELTPPVILANTDLFKFSGKPLVKFSFHYKGRHFDLDIDEASDTEMVGTWDHRPQRSDKPDEPDVWVASGTGVGVPGDDRGEEDSQAAAAKYGQ